jgi:hypothetical protein
MRKLIVILFALLAANPALAQSPDDETKIRAVIAEWYKRVGQPEAKAVWALMAPNGVDGGPGYAEIPPIAREKLSAAAYSGPLINNELASKALRFAYDIDRLVVNANLAKADVWERGYFYAWSAQKTYELAADAMFVLEKQPNGEWLILAHRATSQGIPPNRITSPMPDLRADYYAACPTCDPVADAQKAREW